MPIWTRNRTCVRVECLRLRAKFALSQVGMELDDASWIRVPLRALCVRRLTPVVWVWASHRSYPGCPKEDKDTEGGRLISRGGGDIWVVDSPEEVADLLVLCEFAEDGVLEDTEWVNFS